MSKTSKLVAILLIAVVVAAGAGYWLFSPKPASEIVNYTSTETSLEVNRRTPEQTLTSSTSSPTTSAAENTLWINVTAAKPVSYYISLLKSAGGEPYVELGWELQALPDATNATAVAEITYLALNGTNPEVKEAFQLMMKGGTPSPSDFRYAVPNYNTELQILYWLACQNEFKKDDTLALAIAMVNGLWITMGDNQVREAVRKDTSDLLAFFRETSELQRQKGQYQLEDYPLEAKVALAWTGSQTASPEGGPFSLSGNAPTPSWSPIDFTSQRLQLRHYRWDTVSIDTLVSMRDLLRKNDWVKRTVAETVNFLDLYLFANVWGMPGGHWNFTGSWDERITVDDIPIAPRNFVNVDFEYEYFLKHGSGIGVCQDEVAFLDALLKSSGIAVITSGWELIWKDNMEGHGFVLYYEPSTKIWMGPEVQLTKWNGHPGDTPIGFFVYKPPIAQLGFLRWHRIDWSVEKTLPVYDAKPRHTMIITYQRMHDMFTVGTPTSEMKQWLLYS